MFDSSTETACRAPAPGKVLCTYKVGVGLLSSSLLSYVPVDLSARLLIVHSTFER